MYTSFSKGGLRANARAAAWKQAVNYHGFGAARQQDRIAECGFRIEGR
jgi:hypothetical protein